MSKFSNMILGKKSPISHSLMPKFASLILPTTVRMPPPPESVDYTERVSDWPMFDNDKIGDCTIASVAHLIQLYTSYTKPAPWIMDQAEVVRVYSAVGGYNPNDPTTDNGAYEMNVLNYWMNNGVYVNGTCDKISGYAKVNPKDINELKYSVYWFGGLYIGMALPKVWQEATDNEWMMPDDTNGDNAPGTWGGHAVPVVGYDKDGITVITWGEEVTVEWDAYTTYCDEAYAVISPDFLNQQGKTPANFDWPYLLAGMQHIREGAIIPTS